MFVFFSPLWSTNPFFSSFINRKYLKNLSYPVRRIRNKCTDPNVEGSFAFCTKLSKSSYDIARRCRTYTSALTLSLYILANTLHANKVSASAALAKLQEMTGSERQLDVPSTCPELIRKGFIQFASTKDPNAFLKRKFFKLCQFVHSPKRP